MTTEPSHCPRSNCDGQPLGYDARTLIVLVVTGFGPPPGLHPIESRKGTIDKIGSKFFKVTCFIGNLLLKLLGQIRQHALEENVAGVPIQGYATHESKASNQIHFPCCAIEGAAREWPRDSGNGFCEQRKRSGV